MEDYNLRKLEVVNKIASLYPETVQAQRAVFDYAAKLEGEHQQRQTRIVESGHRPPHNYENMTCDRILGKLNDLYAIQKKAAEKRKATGTPNHVGILKHELESILDKSPSGQGVGCRRKEILTSEDIDNLDENDSS